MGVDHEYWLERATGAIWAVELEDGNVVACHGPLTAGEVDDEVVDFLVYSPVGVTWIVQNRERFVPYPTAIPFIPQT